MGLWPPSATERRRARFAELVEPILPDLHRFARRLEGDPVRAEDLVQQTVETGLLRLDQLRDDGAFRVWITRIARNHFLNARKRRTEAAVDQATLERVVALDRSPEEAASAKALGDRVQAALDTLPQPQREALVLVDGMGFKFAEAAQVLDLPIGTTASRVARARVAMRAALEDVAREQGVIR